jgi:hypothetical protein
MGKAREAGCIAEQTLSSRDCPVRPVPGPIPDQPQGGCDVRRRQPGRLPGVHGGVALRCAGLPAEQRVAHGSTDSRDGGHGPRQQVLPHRAAKNSSIYTHERVEGGRSLQIADVLAEHDLVADPQRHCVFELRTGGEDGGLGSGCGQREGGIAWWRWPAGIGQTLDQTEHAVVGMAGDRAVVEQKAVGDRAEPFECLPLVGGRSASSARLPPWRPGGSPPLPTANGAAGSTAASAPAQGCRVPPLGPGGPPAGGAAARSVPRWKPAEWLLRVRRHTTPLPGSGHAPSRPKV